MTGRRLVLALILILGFTSFAGAQVPVIVQINGLTSITSIVTSLGGTLLDGIPEANIYLLNLPVVPPNLVTSLLGIQWVEVNIGVTLPSLGQTGVFQIVS